MYTIWICVCLSILYLSSVFINADNDDNVGPGLWSVINIDKCELSENNPIQSNFTKKRIGRGKDGFTGSINLGVTLTNELSLSADICKVVGGGNCKPFMVMKDDSFCKFMWRHMPGMFQGLLEGWGVDPPDCPVKKDIYTVTDYPFNYSIFDKPSVYGVFKSEVRVFDGQEELMCLFVTTSFVKNEDVDDD